MDPRRLHMKVDKKQKILLILISASLLILNIVTSVSVYHKERNLKLERAANVSKAYAMEVKRDLSYGTDCTQYIKELVAADSGQVDRFDDSARLITQKNVEYLALVRDGAIYDSYTKGVYQEKLDGLMKLSQVASAAEYAAKTRKPVLYGPFSFPGVGRRVIVIDPVLLKNSSGKAYLWGYAVAVMRVPDVYKHTLKELRSLRYDYCLDSTISPAVKKQVSVEAGMGNKETLTEPTGYTIDIGQCRWTLNVEPIEGWNSNQALFIFIEGLIMNLFLVVSIYTVIRIGQQEKTMRRMAYVDALTGIFNRGGFMDRMDQYMNSCDSSMTTVFIDIDDFKVINDVYGHMVGDKVLIDLADHLSKIFAEDSVVGRTGGDEFCVLITGKTAEESRDIINRVVEEQWHVTAGDKEVSYSVSAGFADYPAQAHDRQQLLIMADEALYAAKAEGKNKSKHYESRMSGIKREQMGFSAKTIASGIPGAFLIYKADEDEQIFFANEDLIRLFGCRDMEDFMDYTQSSFRHVVHPDDLERVEKEIRQQIELQREDPENPHDYYDDYVEYRIITRDGETVPVIDLGRLVYDDHYGEVFFVFIFRKEIAVKRSMIFK